MRGLIDFVVRYRNYITLSTLVVMSFSLMSIGNLSDLGGFRAVIVGSIGWIQSAFAWIPNPVALKSENTALRELNLQLAVEVARSRQAIVENETLRKLMKLPQYTDHRLITADIVGKTTTEQRNYATIDKGKADGIREGMSCINDAGLVGIVIGVSDHYAVLELLINRDTRVSAKVLRTRVDGVIQWEGENILVLKNVPRSLDVRKYDAIVTSAYSAKYPANIVIGRVTAIEDEPNSLFHRIVVQPSVNFATLEQLYVVDARPDPERINLERKIDETSRTRVTQ
jgi:rod shape-determining protein MreC